MILREEHDAPAVATRALQTLVAAGIPRDEAGQLAVAVGAAAAAHAWPQDEMDYRLARTLHQLGHAEASRTLLAHAVGPDVLARAGAERILVAPPDLFPLIRAGMLRAVAGDAWRLDAAALGRPDVPMELAYLRLVEVLSERLLPLWESSEGRGELALAGWRGHARAFAANRRAAARRCRAWRRDLAEALTLRARRRGWTSSPRVILAEPI